MSRVQSSRDPGPHRINAPAEAGSAHGRTRALGGVHRRRTQPARRALPRRPLRDAPSADRDAVDDLLSALARRAVVAIRVGRARLRTDAVAEDNVTSQVTAAASRAAAALVIGVGVGALAGVANGSSGRVGTTGRTSARRTSARRAAPDSAHISRTEECLLERATVLVLEALQLVLGQGRAADPLALGGSNVRGSTAIGSLGCAALGAIHRGGLLPTGIGRASLVGG